MKKEEYISYFLKKAKKMRRFDLAKMPLYPKSDERLVEQMIVTLRRIMMEYHCVTVADLCDVIEMCGEHRFDTCYSDTKRGWKHMNDFYILRIGDIVTIGVKHEPIPLD